MKFGSWTYDGFQVDLRHQDAEIQSDMDRVRKPTRKEDAMTADIVELGIDLKEFYKSVEWDILEVPAQR